MEQEMKVGFIGNPNCGKTTLFNAFTGAHLKVANWPGVTVERWRAPCATTTTPTSWWTCRAPTV